MFKKYEYKINLAYTPFWNLRFRDRTALVLCRDGAGNFVLGTKAGYYPEGICRMLGGGIDSNEQPIDAVKREINEEMNINVTEDELEELFEIRIEASLADKKYQHTVYVYFLNSTKDDYVEGDDVSSFVRLSEDGFRELLKNYSELENSHLFEDGDNSFSWGDYGRVYGHIHQMTLDEVLKREL